MAGALQTPCWTAWLASESITLAVLTAVQLLPPCQRAAVILRDVPGFHASEAARLLGTTEGS